MIRKYPKNIFFLGAKFRSVRSFFLFSKLAQSYNHCVYLGGSYYLRDTKGFDWLGYLVSRVLNNILDIILIIRSDVVYIMPRENWSGWVFLAKFFKCKIIVDYHGSAYVTQVESRMLYDANSRIAKKLRKRDILLLEAADVILVASFPEFYFNLDAIKFSTSKLKAEIVPIGLPVSEIFGFEYKNSSLVADSSASSKTLVIGWWGYPSRIHGLDFIFSALSLLNDRGVDFRFVMFVGKKELSGQCLEAARDKKIAHLVAVDHTSNFNDLSLAREICNSIDVSLGLFGEDARVANVMSHKVIESAMLGVPNISAFNHSLAEYFSDGRDIIFVNNTPTDLADCLATVSRNRSLLRDVGSNAQKLYNEHFSSRHFIERVWNIFNL